MTTGAVPRPARLGWLVALLAILATGRPAAAEPSPNISCPFAGDAAEFASLAAMPPAIVAELAHRMSLAAGAEIASFIAPRDAAWQVTDVVDEPLPGRRFIRGGRVANRWYVWYESGGIAHLYHAAIFDLPPSAPTPRLVAHVQGRLDDLCPETRAFLQSPGTDAGVDGGFW